MATQPEDSLGEAEDWRRAELLVLDATERAGYGRASKPGEAAF